MLGSITGTVFDDPNGNGVFEPSETPLPAVTVELIDPATSLVVATTHTSADGRYTFTGLAAGPYLVRETNPPGYVSTTSDLVPASVVDGGVVTIDFGDQQQGTVSGTVYNDLNGNGLHDAGEPGLTGVSVHLTGPSCPTTCTTTAAADGTYLFTGVSQGSYTVSEIDPAGFVSTTPNTVPVHVGAGGGATADFGDQQRGTVVGTVFEDLNGDGTQEPGETGLAGVTVTLRDTNGSVVATTLSSVDGTYMFVNVEPGDHTVWETDPPGYTSTTANMLPISVPPNGSATADFGDRQLGTLTGTVYYDWDGDGSLDPEEAGIGGVRVSVRNTSTGQTLTTTTAADGSYAFTDLPAGSYEVSETDPEGYESTTPNTVAVALASGGSGNANFGDRQYGTLSGVVFYDLNGDGIQGPAEHGLGGVTVTLSGGTCPASGCVTTTAGNGSYIFTHLQPGSYTVVETNPPSYVSTTPDLVEVTVPPAGAASANFGDQLVGSISGFVYNDLDNSSAHDPGEPGLPGVKVDLVNSEGVVVASTTTAGDGSFLFTDIPAGTYKLVETDPQGFMSTTSNDVSVKVPDGGAGNGDFGDRQPPDVAIDKTLDSVLVPGREAVYRIDIRNVGGTATVGALTVIDRLPAGLSYIGASGPGWSCTRLQPSMPQCVSAALLAPGQAAAPITLHVRVATNATSPITNVAIVSTPEDTDETNNIDSVTTPLDPPPPPAAAPVAGPWGILGLVAVLLVIATYSLRERNGFGQLG